MKISPMLLMRKGYSGKTLIWLLSLSSLVSTSFSWDGFDSRDYTMMEAHKGKRLGESCKGTPDCGPSNIAQMPCIDGVCTCLASSYYDELMNVCVSLVGGGCAQAKNIVGHPETFCVKFAVCEPFNTLTSVFGNCICKKGYKESPQRTCIPDPGYSTVEPVYENATESTPSITITESTEMPHVLGSNASNDQPRLESRIDNTLITAAIILALYQCYIIWLHSLYQM